MPKRKKASKEIMRTLNDESRGHGRYMSVQRDLFYSMTMEAANVLAYLQDYGAIQEDDGNVVYRGDKVWFCCMTATLRKALKLSKRKHERILHELESRGVISRQMMRNPAKRHICINYPALNRLLNLGYDRRMGISK